MAHVCALCSARYEAEDCCEERFNLALATEIEDPAYGIVHHLIVPEYTLQHNGYSQEGWRYTRALLAELVHGELSPSDTRRKYREVVDSGNRDWSITRGPKFERFDEITWTRTVADVRFGDPECYCADVRAWAAAVLADTERVLG